MVSSQIPQIVQVPSILSVPQITHNKEKFKTQLSDIFLTDHSDPQDP